MTENSGGNAITKFGYQFRTAGVIGGGSGSGAGGAGRSHWRLERRCREAPESQYTKGEAIMPTAGGASSQRHPIGARGH